MSTPNTDMEKRLSSSLPQETTAGVSSQTITQRTASPSGEGRYAAFTKAQKRVIVFLATFAAWFSTLSSFIYFPAIPTLARDLDVSTEHINLTVTSYLLVSAFAPSLVGAIADQLGRRPAYLITLAVYICANVGIALQSSFSALFALRMIQSAGISGKQPDLCR